MTIERTSVEPTAAVNAPAPDTKPCFILRWRNAALGQNRLLERTKQFGKVMREALAELLDEEWRSKLRAQRLGGLGHSCTAWPAPLGP